jgi:hypothetical protein
MSEGKARRTVEIDGLTVGIGCIGGLLLAGVVAGITLSAQAMKQSPAHVTLTLPFGWPSADALTVTSDDPEFLARYTTQIQEQVAAQEAMLGEQQPQAEQDVEWWKQEVTRFRFDQSMIGKQIDDLERSFDDYQAKVAGEKLADMDIEWLEESRCEDGVCTSTYPAAERRWEILSDEAREASTAELSQRHASELKALSGRVDDLGRLMRQSISDHHEMRGLLAYYGIDPETGEIQTDLEDDRKNPWVRRAKSLEAENARLKEALDAADVEMDASHQP